jgi:hypothetical protein
MSAKAIPVKLQLPGNSFTEGKFTFYDKVASSPAHVQLDLFFLERTEIAVAPDFFEALVQLRVKLEPENISICCNGAIENVYPSAMARSMGEGVKAYRLTLGKQAKIEDLVSIFEDSLGEPPSPVEKQRAFYEEWIKSLSRA